MFACGLEDLARRGLCRRLHPQAAPGHPPGNPRSRPDSAGERDAALKRRLLEFRPDVVAFSWRNMQTFGPHRRTTRSTW